MFCDAMPNARVRRGLGMGFPGRDHASYQVSKKSENFFYLLPGQGPGSRKRFFRNLFVAIIVGFIASALFVVFYCLFES